MSAPLRGPISVIDDGQAVGRVVLSPDGGLVRCTLGVTSTVAATDRDGEAGSNTGALTVVRVGLAARDAGLEEPTGWIVMARSLQVARCGELTGLTGYKRLHARCALGGA